MAGQKKYTNRKLILHLCTWLQNIGLALHLNQHIEKCILLLTICTPVVTAFHILMPEYKTNMAGSHCWEICLIVFAYGCLLSFLSQFERCLMTSFLPYHLSPLLPNSSTFNWIEHECAGCAKLFSNKSQLVESSVLSS